MGRAFYKKQLVKQQRKGYCRDVLNAGEIEIDRHSSSRVSTEDGREVKKLIDQKLVKVMRRIKES